MTSMIKKLIFFIILILCYNYHFVKAATTHGNYHRSNKQVKDACHETCYTRSCFKEANNFLRLINTNVNPCDNFYQFVCGNFIKEKVIDDQAAVVNTFSIAQTEVSSEIFNEVIKEIKPSHLGAFKKTKIYYRNCMNQSRTEEEGTKPLFKILNKIGGWPVLLGNNWTEDHYDWKDTIFKIRDENFLIFFPVISIIRIDSKNSKKNIIRIEPAQTTISRTFSLGGSNNTLMKAYYDYMVDIAVKLGANRVTAHSEMKKVLDFELDIYKIKMSPEELLNITESDNQITIKELSKKYPSIPWLSLFNKIFNPSDVFVNETEIIQIIDPEFISKVEKLIENTPKRVLANYLAWEVVYITLMYMPELYQKRSLDFLNIIEGTKKRMNRESWCLNEMMVVFPISLSAMYVRKHFNKKIKESVSEVFLNLKNQIRKNLEEIDWMDNITRKAAIEKLETMGVSIGYADELMNDSKVEEYYKELEINPGSYLKSVLNITLFLEKQNYKALRESISNWTVSQNVAVINAYHILQRNVIEIPAGFLRSFYRFDRPQYLNYGTVGTMIGHEIIHGFDNQGRKYDKNGNQNNWWQASTEEKFFEKATCIIDQYSNFTVAEVELQVNGVVTQNENIADNGGFKLSYHAYNDWIKRNNLSEPCLPNLSYTQRQLFWISAASNWCSKQRPEYLKNLISTDEHSPENARIIISFSNIKEFADDFGCQVGTKMNPKKKCIIW